MRRLLFVLTVLVVFAGSGSPAMANHGGEHQAIASGPDAYTNSTSATFSFKVRDSTSYVCYLDGAAGETCGPGFKTYSGLAPGVHTLTVSGVYALSNPCQSVDTEGHCVPGWEIFPVSDSWRWTIDLTKPTATLTAPIPWAQLGSTTAIKWTGSDGSSGSGIKQFTLAQKRAPYNGGFGTVTFSTFDAGVLGTSTSLLAGSTDCFAVRAIDNVGNVGAFSPWRCITLPLDDRALSRSSGWTPASSGAYFNSTYTGTSSVSRSLAKSGAQVRRIGLVATKCAACGTVVVRAGSTTIGTVNLYSSTTKYRQLISLPAISLRTATVSVVTTSSGKPVYIDGLALSRQ